VAVFARVSWSLDRLWASLMDDDVGFYVLCNEEELWHEICVRKWKGKFRRRASWKSTCLFEQFGRCVEDQIQLNVKFHSKFLSDRWFRSHAQLTQFIPTLQLVEKISVGDPRLDPSNFRLEFDGPRKPVCICGATDNWLCRSNLPEHKWTLESLAVRYPDAKWIISHTLKSVERLEMTFSDYLLYIEQQSDETPHYIFDHRFGETAPDMLGEYDIGTVGPIFQDDFLSVIGKKRPNYRWFVAGPARTGAPWHKDPGRTSAWNALIQGHKRWALYPPDCTPPGVSAIFEGPDDKELAHAESPTSLQWYLDVYPTLTEEQRPLEIIQNPGDVIFIPSGWWHLVLNLDVTISVTENFVNESNLRAALDDIHNDSGTSGVHEFEEGLRRKRPDLNDALSKAVCCFKSGFSSEFEYVLSFRDGEFWQNRLDRIIEHHKMTNMDSSSTVPTYKVLTKRLNPLFLRTDHDIVLKLYSKFASADTGFFSGALEPAMANDGAGSKRAELCMLSALSDCSVTSFLYPKVVAQGVFYGQGTDEPWNWPYIVTSRLSGVSIGSVRANAKWKKNSAARWILKRSMTSVARWLGRAVFDIHSMGEKNSYAVYRELFQVRPPYNVFLDAQRVYGLASHWRKAVLSKQLLREAKGFVESVWYLLQSKPSLQLVPLHGDLQEENIFVSQIPDPSTAQQEIAEFLEGAFHTLEPHVVSSLVYKLVNEEHLRVDTVVLMSDKDLDGLGLPLGPKLLLKQALSSARPFVSGSSHSQARGVFPVGIIDFGDALIGDPLYELVALHVSTFRCDTRLLYEFLAEYHARVELPFPDFVMGYPVDEFPVAAMALTLLHPCETMQMIYKCKPELERITSLRALAQELWGFQHCHPCRA